MSDLEIEYCSTLTPNCNALTFAGPISGQWVLRNKLHRNIAYVMHTFLADVFFIGPDWTVIGTCGMTQPSGKIEYGVRFSVSYKKATDTTIWSWDSVIQEYPGASSPQNGIDMLADMQTGRILIRTTKDLPFGKNDTLDANSFLIAKATVF